MSLLMDALKKAEQEKKEAAKRLEETRERTTIAETHPASDATGEHATAPEQPAQESGGYPGSTMELSLAPLDQVRQGQEPAVPAPQPASSSEEPTLNRFKDELDKAPEPELAPVSMEESIPPTPAAPASKADTTFHGAALEEMTDDAGLFEETVQGEAFQAGDSARSYDETLPGVPAAQLAKDIGGKDQPTPVAAETVFTATQTASRSTFGFKAALIGLCVFLVVATSVWYYYWVTPVTPDVPSPWVARGIEATPPSANTPAAGPGTSTPATTPAPVGGPETNPATPATTVAETTPSANSPGPTATAEGSPSAVESTAAAAAGAAPAATEQPGSESGATPAANAPAATPGAAQAAPSQPTTPAAAPAAMLPPEIEMPASAIRISRSRGPAPSGVEVTDAFNDYQAGNYDAARAKYIKALKQQPENVDAMLGMAAIDLKQNDPDSAAKWYGKVLAEDPANRAAAAGLIALDQSGDSERSESALKIMLHDDPDNPFLYFILGNIYAGQERWADAQQAYFDAYRNDSTNADYALNLAVSLDRLGQRQTALDYYNVALKLAGQGGTNFNQAAVTARIQALSGKSSR